GRAAGPLPAVRRDRRPPPHDPGREQLLPQEAAAGRPEGEQAVRRRPVAARGDEADRRRRGAVAEASGRERFADRPARSGHFPFIWSNTPPITRTPSASANPGTQRSTASRRSSFVAVHP